MLEAAAAAAVDAGVVMTGLVEVMPEGDSSSSGRKMATGLGWSESPRPVGGSMESAALAILQLELGGGCVANEDLWEVAAVGSPRVRAMT